MTIAADNSSMYQMLLSLETPAAPQAFNLLYDHARKKRRADECCRVAFRSHKLLANSIEEQHVWSLARSKEKKQGKKMFTPKGDEEALKIIQSEPDEYGLRIELKTRDDARVAVQQLLLNAFTDTFGTSIKLYSIEGQQFNTFGHIYSFEAK